MKEHSYRPPFNKRESQFRYTCSNKYLNIIIIITIILKLFVMTFKESSPFLFPYLMIS